MRLPTVTSLRSALRYHRTSFSKWWKACLWNRLLILLIAVYGIIFSVLTSLRILALSAFALDLGVYNQGMYTTVTYGRFFSISGLPGGPAETLFGGHFTPILFLLVLPYALSPSPFTLVVIQTWAIAFAAVPIYRLAQRLLKSDLIAFAFALVFLLHPATQGVNWFDFHAEAFLLLTLPAALYFYEREKWKWFLAFVILSLAAMEMATVLVGVFAIGALMSEAWSWGATRQKPDRRKVWILFGLVFLSVAWALLAGAFVNAMNPGAVYFAAGFGYWNVLGASTLPSVPFQILLHPDRALAALSYDGTLKLWYLIVLFAPVQLLTLRSPRATFSCLPWLALSLFSNWSHFYLVGNQYPSYVLPFIFYGAVVGLARPWSPLPLVRRIAHWPQRPLKAGPNRDLYPRVLIGITVVLLIVVSPMGPWAIGSDTTGRAPVIGVHERAVFQLYGLIPSNASVLTQNNLYPLLSSRLNVNYVPVNMMFSLGTSFNTTMDRLTSGADYILVDIQSDFVEAALLLSWPNVSARYSVVGAADGALLLEHGNHGLSMFQPLLRSFGYVGVIPENATVVSDPAASDAYALLHTNLTTSHFWYGPFLLLPPGNYTVSYRLKVDRPSAGLLLGLPVLFHPVRIQAQVISYAPYGEEPFFLVQQLTNQVYVNVTDLQGASVPAAGSYFTVSTEFGVSELGAYEFPGHAASGSVQLWFDELTIMQQTARNSGTIPIRWS